MRARRKGKRGMHLYPHCDCVVAGRSMGSLRALTAACDIDLVNESRFYAYVNRDVCFISDPG